VLFEEYYPASGRWAEVRIYPLPDGGLASSWRDVTERRRLEESRHFLGRASEILADTLDYETTLGALVRLVVPRLADWASIEMLDEDGRLRQLAVAHVDPAKVAWARELSARYPIDPDAPTGAPNVVRTGKPELYPRITDEMLVAGAVDDEQLRIVREIGFTSLIVVPLAARERTLGTLTLVSAESGRSYDEADLDLASELARRAAIAVDNARLHHEAIAARQVAERAAAEAAEANRAKSEFLARMSHELRTPLNAIGGYAELMQLGIHGPVTDEQKDALARVTRAQRHLLGLINDVLNYAKLEAGRVEYDLREIAAAELVGGIEPMIAPQLAAKGLRYRSDPIDGSLTAMADREKTRQILLNLLSNSIKFTPAEGRIHVRATGEAEWVRIEVEDTGIGIPPDRLATVFEPFVQLGRAVAGQEGTGLGLAISRDLARGMGGDLVARSAPDEGSTFTLLLPRSRR
jgi:signal transduction histidine kinase